MSAHLHDMDFVVVAGKRRLRCAMCGKTAYEVMSEMSELGLDPGDFFNKTVVKVIPEGVVVRAAERTRGS